MSYIVQTSSNLTDWQDIPIGLGTLGQTITITDNPPAGATSRFMRLNITAP